MDRSGVGGDCWVHPALEVGSSRIEGRGLFALEPLAAGIVVMELGGRLVHTDELMALIASATAYVDSVTVDDDVHLVLPPGTPAHFANHSCEPNLVVRERYSVATKRAIAVGEELTIDYATISGAPGVEVRCRCGSGRCRGTVEV